MITNENEFTEEDIGETITVTTAGGTYINQTIVGTHCLICGERMIGTMAAAGGFLARHEHFHNREMQLAQISDMT